MLLAPCSNVPRARPHAAGVLSAAMAKAKKIPAKSASNPSPPASSKGASAQSSKKQKLPAAPSPYSPALGKKALESLAPRLNAMKPSELVTTRIDIETATLAALRVAGYALSEAEYPRFAGLPAEEFDIAHLDGLAEACYAVLFALGEVKAERALETTAKLPAALMNEALLVEARMQELCEYYFKADPELGPEVARLSPGSGHRDLAGDLLGYARIYEKRPEVVAADPKNYRASDLADARRLAGEILGALGGSLSPSGQRAFDAYVRAWTWLNATYDEVRSTGLWLHRRDPKKDELFPSLFAVGRSKPSPRKSKKGGGEAEAPKET